MASFAPRSGKADYIKERGGRYFYRRVIPKKYRKYFDDKVEWCIPLTAPTEAGRKAEAGALAHQHNCMIKGDWQRAISYEFNETDGSLNSKIDLSPENMPIAANIPPFEFYRGGKIVQTYKVAAGSDPEFLSRAERDGYLPISQQEYLKQHERMRHSLSSRSANTSDAKELAELKAKNTCMEIDEIHRSRGETLRSILPKMHARNKPAEPTQRGHFRVVEEFIGVHGNLPLRKISKAHVVEYIQYLGQVTFRGKPLEPSTVQQRLDKLKAILQFAKSEEAVEKNVCCDVTAPKDNRPLGDQTRKPFEKSEIQALIDAATEIWSKRRYQTAKTRLSRQTDLLTALHMQLWTGARPEEICQLRLDDVDLSRKGFHITNESDDLGVKPRRTKNEQSVRGVPIHDRLLPIIGDHIEYVSRVSNSGLLFPSFRPESEKGRYASPIGEEWSKHLRPLVTSDAQKVLYSLRHSWAGEAMRIGMPEEIRNTIMGHATVARSKSSRRYIHHFDNLENQLLWINKMNCLGV